MKPIRISFLFFYCIVLQLFCVANYVHAQKTTDTINYRNLILKPKSLTDLTNGYKYYLNSKELKLKESDTFGAIYDLRLISIALKKKSLFYESENYAIEALLLLDNSKNKDSAQMEARIGLYNHLGLINKELENYGIAIDYFKKVIASANTIQNKNTGIKNLASVYSKNKEYTKAIEGYLSVFEYTKVNESQVKIARLLDNLGFAQSKTNDENALLNLNQALLIRKKENYYSEIITSYLHLAEHYNDNNDKKKALDLVNKALEISKDSKNKYYEMHSLSFKISLNDNIETIRYKTLNDSINKSKQLYKNQFASNKYEFFKEKKRADANQLLKEKEKSKKVIYQSMAILIILLTVFIVLRLKDRHKKDKQEQVYTIESQISKKVHDEVANDVFQVMTQLQSETDISDNLKNDIEHIYDKARDISKQLGELDVKGDYKTVLNDLVLSYNNSDTNVIVKGISKIQWQKFSKNKKTALYKVLQELLINMKKHSEASVAVITFLSTPKKTTITYNDDGIGCELKKSTGLLNVENRIKAINGAIIFESEIDKGFKVKITV